MNMYMDKLSRMVPVVKCKHQMLTEQGPKATLAKMEFMPEGNYYERIPYLQKVEEMDCAGSVEEEKRIFIVTEEDNIAIKTAYSYLVYSVYEGREDIWKQMEEQGFPKNSRVAIYNQDGMDIKLRVISMEGERKQETCNTHYQYLAVGVPENGVVFFNGLEDNSNLQDKLDVIVTSPAKIQFVQISKEQMGLPWVRELMMERESEVLILPKVSNRYYEGILEQLLEGERYRLGSDLTPEQLVRSIRKKCTNKFQEEDLAWSLDQAVKKARKEGRNVLENSDFALEQVETESALTKLEKMTGLAEMKQLAAEYAALSREQARNGKIEEICKHTIYVGAPGSGKTECGKMLARIMSEEGQSNGIFVMASRKDVIGEYIGHTAPKIAKLFEKARHGVLFVDEAGFLLQESRSSFNSEAIKEFVRYMELYQDVIVVFALYPHEVEDWMRLDAGLSSRIGRIVKFENYTVNELIQIGRSMCKDRGYTLDADAEPEIVAYLENRMQALKEKFGNAREMRKLVEAAIVAKSVRCFAQRSEELDVVLRREDFAVAIGRLSKEKGEKKRVIGFVTGGETDGEAVSC